jgi:hypothetical protein
MKRFALEERWPGHLVFREADAGAWVGYVDAVADRRERIATACLAGVLSNAACDSIEAGNAHEAARFAIQLADALIAELDKPKGER